MPESTPRRSIWARVTGKSPFVVTLFALVLGLVVGAIVIVTTTAPGGAPPARTRNSRSASSTPRARRIMAIFRRAAR
jgi:hypothetical protein